MFSFLTIPDFMSATQMINLSDLPHDVLVVIAKHLKKLEDFVCFRCVSKSLLAAAKDEYFEGLRLRQRQRIPYLLLPVRDDGNDDDVRELYSLVEGESIVSSLKVAKFNRKKCFESLGWLLTVEEDGNMSLLDPFSGNEIPLPHQNTLPEYKRAEIDAYVFIQKMVLSSRPNEDSNFVLMVIVGGLGQLAYWRLGDKAWNIINKRKGRFIDVYFGNGYFYAIGNPMTVWLFNFAGNDSNAKCRRVINCDPIQPDLSSMDPTPIYDPDNYYAYGTMNQYILKTIDDALFIIIRISPNLSEDRSSYITTKFLVYEIDTVTRTWKEISSLGNMAIFLGQNSTIAVDASRFSGEVMKANHIYFTNDSWEFDHFQSPKGGGLDIGVYNFETTTVEPIHPGEPLISKVSVSLWINPCF